VRMENGETLIVFQSNGPPPPGPGNAVVARWDAASTRVVHDEDTAMACAQAKSLP